ncbi:hypothetical protein HY469_03080 [Candidatus Roizmanbacteria bacterium]|nr:hypothetical protein [Candidatus Roizmanbacteria bacterium]
MVKKSKKKKIISDYRRKLQLLRAQERRSEVKPEPVPVRTPEKSEQRQVISSLERESLQRQTAYVMKDLKKTLTLSVIGIGIIVGLYFFPLR